MSDKRAWDTGKLDELLLEIHQRVVAGIKEAEGGDEDETAGVVAECIGYWMYRLAECQDGPLPQIMRTVEGPLFAEATL
jgi:hypothetical protein